MTRRRGILVESPAGRGRHGAREVMRYRMLTCLPLQKGQTFKFKGRMFSEGDGTLVVDVLGAHYHLVPLFNTMKQPYGLLGSEA